MRIGLVVNEVSGDQLAAALIQALRERVPDVQFEGMTGPLMEAAGCRSLATMDPVMGLFEVLGHLPGLLRTRRRLYEHFLRNPPDLVLGVDAPDFNLALETRLRAAGIKTAHFVSPTVWAWRTGRVKKLRKAVDLMLCIFDFEVPFLTRHQVPAVYVGHPMADQIPLESPDAHAVREDLGLNPQAPVVALLPGSRMSEVSRLSGIFAQTAAWLKRQRPDLQFVAPMVNSGIRHCFEQQWQAHNPGDGIVLLEGRAREAMAAADVVLVASGTATLEALLLKKPMVVGYRLAPLTAWFIQRFKMIKTPYVAIANLLSEQPLAEELLLDECRVDRLGPALLSLLDDAQKRDAIAQAYAAVHRRLRQDAAKRAAEAVLACIEASEKA
ncbi:MAG: lipid-A-disaccharide synthase [Candidatus Thiodiazotropha sp.]